MSKFYNMLQGAKCYGMREEQNRLTGSRGCLLGEEGRVQV